MKTRVLWTEQAFERIQEIENYISTDSPENALHVVEKLISRGEQIAHFPESGRVVPELKNAHIREVIEGNYRIVYRTSKKQIEILTIFERHHLLPVEDFPK